MAPESILVWKGISKTGGLPGTVPNRYPYYYEKRPYNTLYCPTRSWKPFPYTNRPRVEYPTCAGYIPYTNINEYCGNIKGTLNDIGWWTCSGNVY